APGTVSKNDSNLQAANLPEKKDLPDGCVIEDSESPGPSNASNNRSNVSNKCAVKKSTINTPWYNVSSHQVAAKF
ncbi:hypothetical protein NDU88_005986, partial [Pleurodeles waltl]